MLTMDLIDIFLSKVSYEEMNLERIITQLTPSWSLEPKVIYIHIWLHILLNEHQAELKKTSDHRLIRETVDWGNRVMFS